MQRQPHPDLLFKQEVAIWLAPILLNYNHFFLSTTRPLHDHSSTQSRHCHYNRTVIQLPFNYYLLLYCSSLVVISKHYGGWWTIYYFSVPHGSGINDSAYCSVNNAFAIVNTLGKGTLMAKSNLKMYSTLSLWGQRTWTCLLLQSVVEKVNKLVFKTKVLNLKRSRDWSLLQNVRKQGAITRYSGMT